MRLPWIYRMAIMIFGLALPLFAYVFFSLSSAITKARPAGEPGRPPISKKKARLWVFALMAWCYLWPLALVYYRFYGDVSGMFVFDNGVVWQDILVVFPAWCGLVAVLEISPYFLTLDLLGWASRWKIFSSLRTSPGKKEPKKGRLARVKIVIAVFFLLYAGFRTYMDTNHVRIKESEIAVKNLPTELQGLKLVLFGDVHMDRYTQERKLEKLKNTLQAGEDDLIFFSGDLTSRGKDFLERAYKIMAQPRATVGSFACMGDHDYWTAPGEIASRLMGSGWTFLENQHRLVKHKGRRILVTGVTFVYSDPISGDGLKKLLDNAPEADVKIMLVHQPREHLVEIAAHYGYHLFLAGHTHGGEIVPHIFGFPVTPAEEETRYCWGIHSFKDLQVVVTNGIGQTLAALRYHAPSELRRLTLVKE